MVMECTKTEYERTSKEDKNLELETYKENEDNLKDMGENGK